MNEAVLLLQAEWLLCVPLGQPCYFTHINLLTSLELLTFLGRLISIMSEEFGLILAWECAKQMNPSNESSFL